MIGLLGCAKAIAFGGLAVCGLFLAETQFDCGLLDTASRAGITADADLASDGATTVAADVEADLTADVPAAACSDNCPAPCATGCADPQGLLSLDGAVDGDATFGAPVAPEQQCGCLDGAGGIGVAAGVDGTVATTGAVTSATSDIAAGTETGDGSSALTVSTDLSAVID